MNNQINRSISLFTILVFIILALSASAIAAEDFKASSKKVIEVCACSSAIDPIKITNTGYLQLNTKTLNGDNNISTSIIDLNSGYFISASGEAAEFFTISQPRFELSSKQDLTNYAYIKVPCNADEGDYELFIDIETDSGIKKRISQIVSVKRCPNLQLTTSLNDKTINPCGFADYSFTIKNTGDFEEIYEINVDKLKDSVFFSQNNIRIKPKESKTVYMHLEPGCNMLRDKQLTLRVKAGGSRFYSELPFILRINQTYYDYNFMLDNAQYAVCQASGIIIPLNIRNYADRENMLCLELEGKRFAKLSSEEIVLVPSSDNTLNINLDIPDSKEGIFDFTISGESDIQNIKKSINFSVNIESCYGLVFDTKKVFVNHSNQSIPIIITNTASKKQTYTLGIEGPEWIDIDPYLIELEPGQQDTLSMTSNPDESQEEGKYDVIIKAVPDSDDSISYSWDIAVILSEKDGFAAKIIYSPGFVYILFALFDVIIIIMGVLLYRRLKKKKEPKQKTLKDIEKEETRKEKKQKQSKAVIEKQKPKSDEEKVYTKRLINKKFMIFVLVAIVILGVICGSGLYFYNNLKGNDTIAIELNESNASIDVVQDIEQVEVQEESNATMTAMRDKMKNLGDDIWIYFLNSIAFIYAYKWYIISVIVLCVAVILLIKHTGIKRLFKGKDAEEKAAKKVEKEKKKSNWKKRLLNKWIITGAVIVVICSLLTCIYFYEENGFDKFKQEVSNLSQEEEQSIVDIDALNNVSKDYSTSQPLLEEETENMEEPEEIIIIDEQEIEVKEEIILPEMVSEEEIKALEGPVLRWEMNKNLTINLNNMFSDPDGDLLIFSASNIKNMSALIDHSTGIVTLAPEENWTGISAVWFTVDDGKGGITTSDKINLVVTLPEEKTAADKVLGITSAYTAAFKKGVVDYAYYIITGFIILIILILITRYNKHMINFLEDESPEKYIENIEKKGKNKKRNSKKKGKKNKNNKK